MTKVILPIKPEFVEKIISGVKKYEFRKKIFKKNIDIVLIYSCSPISKIIGEFKIVDILYDDVIYLWEQTKNYAGITKKGLINYANGNNLYAIEIGEIIIYDNPVCVIKDLLKSIPQSFVYLD